MSSTQAKRGSTPVGLITELGGLEAASVIYLRLWRDGPDAQAQVWNDFATLLVRPDLAPLIASLACDFGLALKRNQLSAPRDMARMRPETTTRH